MKSRMIRLLCLTWALTVLLGSVGTAATRHICLVSGLETPAPEKEKGDPCCRKESPAPASGDQVRQEKCCAVTVTHAHIQTETGNFFSSVKLPVLFVPAQPLPFFSPAVSVNLSRHFLSAGPDKAPPRAGRDLLTFLHTLRI